MGKRKRRPPKRQEPGDAARSGSFANKTGPNESRALVRGRKWPWFVAVALLLLTAAAAVMFRGSRGPKVGRDESLNVLLITLDTTRADHIGCYGYRGARTPNLDALAAQGVRFENAYCSVPLTLPSHASIMTGLEPYHHGVHTNGTSFLTAEKITLAERLKERGYQTAAFTASFSVDSRFGLAPGFDIYDDNFETGSSLKSVRAERRAGQVFRLFSSWLEKKAEGRFFAWVHFYDPHFPYDPPPDSRKDFVDSPYDGEIAYMDTVVGEVVRALREKALLQRTLIAVTGDHGEGLGEKVEQEHGVFIYEMAVRIPLLLYSEGRLPSGLVVGARARTIDIVPTILDLLRIEDPGLDGRSLVPLIKGHSDPDRDVYLESFYPRESWGWSELVGLVSGGWKYIQAPRPELYHLARDPGEERDASNDNPAKAQELKSRLEKMLISAPAAGAGKRELSSSEQEKLRSLGYVQFAGGEGTGDPDPKDRLGDLRLHQQSVQFEAEGNFPEMERVLRELLAGYEDVPAMSINLALAQGMQKKFPEAIDTLKKGLAAVPGSAILRTRLGHMYLVMGDLPAALETMQRALAADPANLDALSVSATVNERWGRYDDALGQIEKALAIEPENVALRKTRARLLGLSGRHDEAIEAFASLTRDYPDDGSYYQFLGAAYAFKKEFGRAVESLETAARLRPDPDVFRQLAVCYKKMDRIPDAIRSLERLLANPGDENAAAIRQARAELERLRALSK